MLGYHIKGTAADREARRISGRTKTDLRQRRPADRDP
jgi:hypothetical protein